MGWVDQVLDLFSSDIPMSNLEISEDLAMESDAKRGGGISRISTVQASIATHTTPPQTTQDLLHTSNQAGESTAGCAVLYMLANQSQNMPEKDRQALNTQVHQQCPRLSGFLDVVTRPGVRFK